MRRNVETDFWYSNSTLMTTVSMSSGGMPMAWRTLARFCWEYSNVEGESVLARSKGEYVEYSPRICHRGSRRADSPNASLFPLDRRFLSPAIAIWPATSTCDREDGNSPSPARSTFPYAEDRPTMDSETKHAHCPISLQTCFVAHLFFHLMWD